jgi:hypothetical protein
LQLVLAQQDRILASAGLLTACCTTAWTREVALLQQAVQRHFQLEELVTGAGVAAMGLRANAVIAGASRRRIRHHLEALDTLSWQDGRGHAERVRRELVTHFLEEESRSYRPLARQQSEHANDALTRRCEAIVEGAAPLSDDA